MHTHQNTTFLFFIVDVLATAAAFVGTTVRQVSLRRTVTQCDVRAYTRSTSESAATEQNKSAVTDHATSLNHVIHWDHAKVIEETETGWTDRSEKRYTSGKNKTSR